MWMIDIAVPVDPTSNGLMIGTGAAASSSLALALAAEQVLADLPETCGPMANLRNKGLARARPLAF